jgi:cytochrome c peroxidase
MNSFIQNIYNIPNRAREIVWHIRWPKGNQWSVFMKSLFLLFFCFYSVLLLAQSPKSTTKAIAINDDEFLIANRGTQTVAVINREGAVIKEWAFDNPVTDLCLYKEMVYVTSSYSSGWLTAINMNTGRVFFKSETGMGARAPIVSDDGSRVYVFNQFQTTVSEVDAHTGKELRQAKALREPVAGVLTPDNKYLFVNNFLPAQRADVDTVAVEVSVIDLTNFEVVKNISLENGSNALRGICMSLDGTYVYVSHNLGRFQVPTSQLYQGWMNTSAVSIIDVKNLSYVGSMLLDEPDRGAAGIWGIATSGEKLFVTHSGTHDVSIIDQKLMRERLENYEDKTSLSYDLSFMYGMRTRLPLVGNGPRSLSVSDGKLYIPTYFSDTLNIVDIESEEISIVAYNPQRKETSEHIGEKIFNDATYCYQNWQSCNGCHPGEARTDALNWDLLNDGIGNPKNCKSLLYSHRTAPSMISGIRDSAELAVRAGFKHIQFTEMDESLSSHVDDYLKSLEPLPSPYLQNGKLTEKAMRGHEVFSQAGCTHCHSGAYFTDMKKHRIGENIEFDEGWDTPTLIEVWRTAPYLFDGRASTLEEVFSIDQHGVGTETSEEEINELVEYVNSL